MDNREARKRKKMRLSEYLKLSDHDRDLRVKEAMDARQSRLVISLVNDVSSGKRIAATFTLDRRGRLVEAGTKKVI